MLKQEKHSTPTNSHIWILNPQLDVLFGGDHRTFRRHSLAGWSVSLGQVLRVHKLVSLPVGSLFPGCGWKYDFSAFCSGHLLLCFPCCGILNVTGHHNLRFIIWRSSFRTVKFEQWKPESSWRSNWMRGLWSKPSKQQNVAASAVWYGFRTKDRRKELWDSPLCLKKATEMRHIAGVSLKEA